MTPVEIRARTEQLLGAILDRFPNAVIAGAHVRGEAPAPASADAPVTLQELWHHVLSEQTTHRVAAGIFATPENSRRAMCADALVRMVESAMNSKVIMGELAAIARRRKAAEAKAVERRIATGVAAAEVTAAPAIEDREAEE